MRLPGYLPVQEIVTDLNIEAPMKEEIEAAVEWWKRAISSPSHDNGDGLQSMMGTAAHRLVAPLSDEQVERFGLELAARLPAHLERNAWAESISNGEWNWGSYLRTIAVDYGPDMILGDSAKAAGIISGLHFPWKTVMWINPGSVRVRCGYVAEEVTVYERKAHERV